MNKKYMLLVEDPGSYNRIRKCVLSFYYDREWIGEPYLPFKPLGLVIWNAPPNSLLTKINICNAYQAAVSTIPIPVRFFESGLNFEQIVKSLKDGIEIANWCDWDRVGPGQKIHIQMIDNMNCNVEPKTYPNVQLVMWGLASDY